MDQRVIQGQVRTGSDHHIPMRLCGRYRHPGVDVGDFSTPINGRQKIFGLLYLDRFKQIVAVENDVAAAGVIRRQVGYCAPQQGPGGRSIRAPAAGIVGKMVRRTDGPHKGLADMGADLHAFPHGNASCPVPADNRFQFVGDIIQGPIPVRLAPLPGAALPGSDHGLFNPLVVI